MPFGSTAYPRSRPMSWHAALFNDHQQFQALQPYLEPQQHNTFANTIVAHGLPTPNSFPVVDEGSLDCPNILLDHMNTQMMSNFPDCYQYINSYTDGSETNPFYFTSGASTVFFDDSTGQTSAPWPCFLEEVSHDIQTAPVSPDFLPVPDLGDTFDIAYVDRVPDQDELVGMGLYDSPADVQSNSLLFGGNLPARRKSLKLEESFEPGPSTDEDENAKGAEQDDASVVSAEFQVDTTTVMPSTQLSTLNQNLDGGGFHSYMVPVTDLHTYPGPFSIPNQNMAGWY